MDDFVAISRAVSHALRHEPWLYELELDVEGWARVEDVLRALRNQWNDLTKDDLARMIKASGKQRHEIKGDSIRALYGHSLAGKLKKTPAEPPQLLYHGTATDTIPLIQSSGLLPMNRQYVHCSVDISTAKQVGQRKAKQPVILTVEAAEAHRNGITFYEGNEQVWLADVIPLQFIQFPDAT